jgi:23S rRNA pseudouridine1911/1915/1917 synthase
MSEERFVIAPEDAGRRLDHFVTARFPDRSRTQVQRWIKDGRVRIGDRLEPARYRVALGDVVSVRPEEPRPSTLEPRALPLSIVHEDDDLVVIDKKAGVQVHPGAGEDRTTLAHALLHRYPDWDAPGSPERPGLVHRLDRDTSGLIVVARSHRAYQHFLREIRSRRVTRRYLALVWGTPAESLGTVDAAIGRDARDRRRMTIRGDGRPARTHYRIVRAFEALSWVEFRLETGRTHQIRVHAAHLGHPVVGDPTYGDDAGWVGRVAPAERTWIRRLLRSLNRQALHAYHLAFHHPVGGRCRFEAPAPGDLAGILESLSDEAVRRIGDP